MNTNPAATAPSATSPTKARCYQEYCCNTATNEVEVLDRSGAGLDPVPWGYCDQHAHTSYAARCARAAARRAVTD